jgi:hypothetical protein
MNTYLIIIFSLMAIVLLLTVVGWYQFKKIIDEHVKPHKLSPEMRSQECS